MIREQMLAAEKVKALEWRDKTLYLLDQRLLPQQEHWQGYKTAADVALAIREMRVRGAPAIGVAAAFGIVLAAYQHWTHNTANWQAALEADFAVLAQSRPTAVNLFWALQEMRDCIAALGDDKNPLPAIEAQAVAILNDDREANLYTAQLGLQVIREACSTPQHVMTHCNTGALATAGFGTALGVIRAAYLDGLVKCVHINETRPWLQGSRLTAWELVGEGIPSLLNVDSTAAHLMAQGKITWVIVGADRITANGDVANKIGTYQLAVLARYHNVKVMVVAPSSTIDMQLSSGTQIPIEERAGEEILYVDEQRIAAEIAAFNPVFDVTPADLIDVIVTERGIVTQPNKQKMQALMQHSETS